MKKALFVLLLAFGVMSNAFWHRVISGFNFYTALYFALLFSIMWVAVYILYNVKNI